MSADDGSNTVCFMVQYLQQQLFSTDCCDRMIPFNKLEKELVRDSNYRGKSVSKYHLAFALRDGGKLQNHEMVVESVDIRSRCFQAASIVCCYNPA
jgi:hypothetical protein